MSTWRRHRAHRNNRASSTAPPAGEGWTIRDHRAILHPEPYASADLGAASDVTAKSMWSEAAPISPTTAISPQLPTAVIAPAHRARHLLVGNIGFRWVTTTSPRHGYRGRTQSSSAPIPQIRFTRGCSPNNCAFSQPPTGEDRLGGGAASGACSPAPSPTGRRHRPRPWDPTGELGPHSQALRPGPHGAPARRHPGTRPHGPDRAGRSMRSWLNGAGSAPRTESCAGWCPLVPRTSPRGALGLRSPAPMPSASTARAGALVEALLAFVLMTTAPDAPPPATWLDRVSRGDCAAWRALIEAGRGGDGDLARAQRRGADRLAAPEARWSLRSARAPPSPSDWLLACVRCRGPGRRSPPTGGEARDLIDALTGYWPLRRRRAPPLRGRSRERPGALRRPRRTARRPNALLRVRAGPSRRRRLRPRPHPCRLASDRRAALRLSAHARTARPGRARAEDAALRGRARRSGSGARPPGPAARLLRRRRVPALRDPPIRSKAIRSTPSPGSWRLRTPPASAAS